MAVTSAINLDAFKFLKNVSLTFIKKFIRLPKVKSHYCVFFSKY